MQKYEGGHVFYGYRPDFSSFHLKGVAGEGRGGREEGGRKAGGGAQME